MIRQWIKIILIFCFLSEMIISLSCCHDSKSKASNHILPILMKLEIWDFDQEHNTFLGQMVIQSLIDSARIEKMEILHPSYVIPSIDERKNSINLLKGELDSLTIKFKITEKKSFKLKGAIYGSYYSGRLKISNVCYKYFFFDGEQYLTGYEINDILGKRKSNGSKITKNDLRVFNNIEIEK
jgi:hypothetical protein